MSSLVSAFLLAGLAIASGPKNISASAADPVKVKAPPRTLDTSWVHKLYHDGDFEQAIGMLESTLKAKSALGYADSLFIFKHLGVMYAANAGTSERGKYYLRQLLLLEPTALIMDMYPSDKIYAVFKSVQDELSATPSKHANGPTNQAGDFAASASPPSRSNSGKESRRPDAKDKSHPSYFWIGATGALAVLAGVGITAYMLSQDKPPIIKTLSVD